MRSLSTTPVNCKTSCQDIVINLPCPQLNQIMADSGAFTKMLQANFEAYLDIRPK